MNELLQTRYNFEHILLVKLFYENAIDEDALRVSKGSILYGLFNEACKMNHIKNPYLESQYKAEKVNIAGSELRLWKISMPPAKDIPLCYRIYLVFDNDPNKMGYYTAERGESNKIFLCGWSRIGAHMNFGFAPKTPTGEIKKFVQIHTDRVKDMKN